jgi:hypothetical protein
MYASGSSLEIVSRQMEKIAVKTKKALFGQRQLQSHSLGGRNPHVRNAIHPRINQYHNKNWSNKKGND